MKKSSLPSEDVASGRTAWQHNPMTGSNSSPLKSCPPLIVALKSRPLSHLYLKKMFFSGSPVRIQSLNRQLYNEWIIKANMAHQSRRWWEQIPISTLETWYEDLRQTCAGMFALNLRYAVSWTQTKLFCVGGTLPQVSRPRFHLYLPMCWNRILCSFQACGCNSR